ncbi:MAG: porin family protein [Bacteroidota bacterium]
MKKIICLSLLIGLSFNTLAQIKFGAGIKGGLNSANIVETRLLDSRTSWHAGIFTRLKFNKLAVQLEGIYSRQGADVSSLQVDYINIPILAKLYILGGLNVFAGPQVGFNISEEGFTAFDQNGNIVEEGDLFKTSDFSAVFGLGVDLPFKLSIDARYNLGFTDINTIGVSGGASEFNNRVFQISIGYLLFG